MSITRERLEARARELGCFPDPENCTDRQLLDAIKAENAAGDWLNRLEQLPTDEAKRAAVHQLAERFNEMEAAIPRVSCSRCGKATREDLQPCLACFYGAKG